MMKLLQTITVEMTPPSETVSPQTVLCGILAGLALTILLWVWMSRNR